MGASCAEPSRALSFTIPHSAAAHQPLMESNADDFARVSAGSTLTAVLEVAPVTHAQNSHIAGLTVAQILDVDIDNLVMLVDAHHSQTKKAILVR